jgi:hypothetical protein
LTTKLKLKKQKPKHVLLLSNCPVAEQLSSR